MPFFLQAADAGLLFRGQHFRDRFRNSEFRADRLRCHAVIAGEHHHPKPHLLELPDGRAARFAHGIRNGNHAKHRPFPRKQQRRFPGGSKALQCALHGCAVRLCDTIFTQESRIARKDGLSMDHSAHTAPRMHFKLLRHFTSDAFRLCTFHHSRSQRMFATGFCACSHGKEFPLRHIRSKDEHVRDRRVARCDRPRLVQHDGIDRMQVFKALRGFDQNAVLRRFPRPHHDGDGRCKAERTGAGDHKDGHRAVQRKFKVLPGDHPGRARKQRDPHHNRHEHAADPVRKPRDGRL